MYNLFGVVSRNLLQCSAVLPPRTLSSVRGMSTKKALVLVADGTEEMEAVITIDVLRRATVNVTVAGVSGSDPVKCSRGVVLVPDLSLEDAIKQRPYDVVILPGGLKGAETFCNTPMVGKLLKEQEESGKFVAAICAAPTALKAHSIGTGKKVTSFPGVKSVLEEGGYQYQEDRVVVDGKLITSRGPGTSFEFALAITDLLGYGDKVPELSKGMLLK